MKSPERCSAQILPYVNPRPLRLQLLSDNVYPSCVVGSVATFDSVLALLSLAEWVHYLFVVSHQDRKQQGWMVLALEHSRMTLVNLVLSASWIAHPNFGYC